MLTNHLVCSFFASLYSRKQSWSKEEVYPKPCYPKNGLIYRSNFVQVSESKNLSGREGQHQFRGEQDRLLARLQTLSAQTSKYPASSCQQPQPGTTLSSPTLWMTVPLVRRNLVPAQQPPLCVLSNRRARPLPRARSCDWLDSEAPCQHSGLLFRQKHSHL